MSAPLFYLPIARPLDINGDIMPLAYLTFFETETLIPVDIFANGALTVPLANPVVANAAGAFPAIYMDPRIAYRVMLHNDADELQYDIDPWFPISGLFVGEIKMYFGDIGDIPAGWHNCDGTNGTPDMRDLFPIGVSATKPLGTTGGTGSISGSTGSAGAHTHTGATGATTAPMPVHSHTLRVWDSSSNDDKSDGWSRYNNEVMVMFGNGGNPSMPTAYKKTDVGGTLLMGEEGAGGTHTHAISSDGSHVHTISGTVTPPFMALYFIMFTGS